MASNDPFSGALNATLCNFLPFYTDNPFSERPKIKVTTIHPIIGLSHECVYRWLRDNKLSRIGAKKLIELSQTPENLRALKTMSRKPPTIQDFAPFVFV